MKTSDGVVLATDLACAYAGGKIYPTADKIANLVTGLPVGIMFTGSGAIGTELVTSLMKELRLRLDGKTKHKWAVDPKAYTVQQLAVRAREFLFDEKCTGAKLETWSEFLICGYSAGKSQPELWELRIHGKECGAPVLLRGEDQIGVNWNGEYEPLHRLILGVGTQFEASVLSLGLSKGQAPEMTRKVIAQLYGSLVPAQMPIMHAIDLTRYLVDTTTGYVRFSLGKTVETIPRPPDIAVITRHEGFQWVARHSPFMPPPAAPPAE